MNELLDEGAVQMLRDRGDDGNGSPILAAVGQLQFEVVEYRLQAEYGVESRLEPLGDFRRHIHLFLLLIGEKWNEMK